MFDAIKADNARYGSFAARLVAELAVEEADIARRNARAALYTSATANTEAPTIAPRKGA